MCNFFIKLFLKGLLTKLENNLRNIGRLLNCHCKCFKTIQFKKISAKLNFKPVKINKFTNFWKACLEKGGVLSKFSLILFGRLLSSVLKFYHLHYNPAERDYTKSLKVL